MSCNKTKHNKKALIKAMTEALGIVTTACLTVKISRKTYYDYYKNDKEFRVEIDDIADVALDFVEGKLLSQIEENNPTSTIFYLKTKGKKRGYIEPQHEKMKNPGLTINNIMPMPTADNVDGWEEVAQEQQNKILNDV